MENMEVMKAYAGANSTGASTKASTKTFMEVMEAFAEVMEASMEVEFTSMKGYS